jgi:hypothetical protein
MSATLYTFLCLSVARNRKRRRAIADGRIVAYTSTASLLCCGNYEFHQAQKNGFSKGTSRKALFNQPMVFLPGSHKAVCFPMGNNKLCVKQFIRLTALLHDFPYVFHVGYHLPHLLNET